MHISEGILTPGVLVFGAAATAAGLAIGLRGMKSEEIPKVALLTAAFFVSSLIHVPVGPSSAHLILNGLLGVILGWAAFPAIFIGLALQAVLFQFGGLTTLGINTLNMALPSVLVGVLVRPLLRSGKMTPVAVGASALAGAGTVMASAFLVFLSLHFSKEGLGTVGKLIFVVHLPVAAIEAVITASVVGFLLKVKPEVVNGAQAMAPGHGSGRKSTAAVAVLLMCLMASSTAHAHKVNVFAWFDGQKVELEAYFASGAKAMHSAVIVTDEKGNKVLEGKTDEEGRLSFVPPGKGRYHVVLVAGMGHHAETDVDVDSDPVPAAPAPEEAGSPEPSPTAVQSGQAVESPVPVVSSRLARAEQGTCLTAQDLERILDQRLKPIQRQIMVLAEGQDKIKPSDVISGLGYILGLMGIAMYVSARKKRD